MSAGTGARSRNDAPFDVAAQKLSDVDTSSAAPRETGFGELDLLLGGGIVPGGVVLVGGAPGIGKSTLLLQLAQRFASGPAVYLCGEESPAQLAARARRLNLSSDLLVLAQTNLPLALDEARRLGARLLIVDSIQTVWLPDSPGYAGSVAQVRDCTQTLVEFAKTTGCAVLLVGHITKDGAIAGPRLLEHLVDTVLYFEGEGTGEHRILRSHKNRFGSVDEICVFTMEPDGLHEVRNPSEVFLGSRAARPSGACVAATMLGSRPVLVEIQALVAETHYGTPRRLSANLDQARLAMIVAVLERRLGMNLSSADIYASATGGLRVVEPAADLALALAVISAFRNVALPVGTLAFGEVGLSGEVRAVRADARRRKEAARLGFAHVISAQQAPDMARAAEVAFG